MVGALTQSYIKNGCNKIQLHKTLSRHQDVIDHLGQIFTIGSKFSQTFSDLGMEILQNNNKFITISQNNQQINSQKRI